MASKHLFRCAAMLALVFGFGVELAACSGDDPDAAGAASGGGTGGSSPATGVGASGGGSASGPSGAGGGGSSTGGGGGSPACLPADVLDTLQKHIEDLTATALFMSGHPGALEADGFLLAPGLASPPAVSIVFAGPLIQECSTAMSYDPYCEQGRCSRIECTGDGAGWRDYFGLDPKPITKQGWTFDDATVVTAWADGATGITFEIAAVATDPMARDWTFQGTGSMDLMHLVVNETFTGLFAHGPADLTFDTTPTATTGALIVAGVTIAETNTQGHLEATGECP